MLISSYFRFSFQTNSGSVVTFAQFFNEHIQESDLRVKLGAQVFWFIGDLWIGLTHADNVAFGPTHEHSA